MNKRATKKGRLFLAFYSLYLLCYRHIVLIEIHTEMCKTEQKNITHQIKSIINQTDLVSVPQKSGM